MSARLCLSSYTKHGKQSRPKIPMRKQLPCLCNRVIPFQVKRKLAHLGETSWRSAQFLHHRTTLCNKLHNFNLHKLETIAEHTLTLPKWTTQIFKTAFSSGAIVTQQSPFPICDLSPQLVTATVYAPLFLEFPLQFDKASDEVRLSHLTQSTSHASKNPIKGHQKWVQWEPCFSKQDWISPNHLLRDRKRAQWCSQKPLLKNLVVQKLSPILHMLPEISKWRIQNDQPN